MRTSTHSSRGRGGENVLGEASLQARLAPDPHAPAEARELLQAFGSHIEPHLLNSIRLLVSELVSNSVRHAGLSRGEHIVVSVALQPKAVRVAVSDPGNGFAERPPPTDPVPDTGWGLHLVDRIADRWGIRGSEKTEVWVELDR
ncbi:MAG: ATP-binding protein [Actinomycetota bacterium]